MVFAKAAATAAVLCALPYVSLAAGPDTSYASRIQVQQSIPAHGEAPFGEQINPYTGSVEFRQPDVVYEGIGPTIRLVRVRGVNLSREPESNTLSPMANWVLSVPKITTIADNSGWMIAGPSDPDRFDRCTRFGPSMLDDNFGDLTEVGIGITLLTEDGRSQPLLKRAPLNTQQPSMTDGLGNPMLFPAVTASDWQVGCLPATSNGAVGEAFLAVSPEGTKYWFDYLVYGSVVEEARPDPETGVMWKQRRMSALMYVSKVEDRFGNWIKYQYCGGVATGCQARLTSITASDGRRVDLAWNVAQTTVDSVTVQPGATNARTWTYQYLPDGALSYLSKVILPDGSQWDFGTPTGMPGGILASQDPDLGKCSTRSQANPDGIGVSYTMTAPSGVVGTFVTAQVWHARSYVPSLCIEPEPFPGEEFEPYDQVAPLFKTYSLVSKTLSGPGLSPQTWTYTYATATGSANYDACAGNGTCAATKWVDVTDPDGDRTRYTYSTRWNETEGQQLRTDAYQGANTLLRTETLTYAASNHGPWPTMIGGPMTDYRSNSAASAYKMPVKTRSIVQQGVTFTWQANGFDVYANPLSTTRSSTPGGHTRTDTTVYDHDTAKWVIGQIAKSTNTNTGLVESETDYDNTTALPLWTKAFGKLQQTLTYNADGTLLTTKDGNNNTTTFANWKRGIPQKITFADAKFKSAVVDDLGQIQSVTDENAYVTNYDYDAMGRLSLIDYPDADTVNWNNTTITFAKNNTAVYGLPAGHWYQAIDTGNGRKVTYFDALWRPVVTTAYDNASIPGTLSQTVSRYDAEGRPTFVSYPQRELSAAVYNTWANPAIALTLPGTDTAYDALGRVTSMQQDSELGVLTTGIAYLSNADGPYTVVTNPRGFQTRTWFQAYDQPSQDLPVQIRHPEDAFTHIVRDVFGKPLTLTRRRLSDAGLATTRSYAYNANQELCRTVEPETGATLLGYDAAGSLKWSSAGLAAATACEPAGTSPTVAARRVDRTYDNRNRPKTLAFPDGLGNQTWTYTPDGLTQSIVTDNGGGQVATNTYVYNKRRLMTDEDLSMAGVFNWPIDYGYNGNGHLALQNWHGVSISFAPNALGQPTQAGTYATGVSYFPNGAMKQFTYGNGMVHTLSQNTRGLPDVSCDFYGTCTGAAALRDVYDYDQTGNVLAILDGRTNAPSDREMSYDGLDRLKTVVSPMYGAEGANYAYDVLDNLIRVRIGGPAARDRWYCYDAKNQLTNLKTVSCAGTSVMGLGYDLQGNLNNRNGVAYTFDYGNRLRSVDTSPVSQYAYDGHGRRVWDFTSNDKYSHYNAAGQLTMTGDERANTVTEYIHLNGSMVATRERDVPTGVYSTRYYHTDALGSPVAATNENRTIIEKSEYEPYGKLINRPLKDGPGYTGHVADAATGMIYMQQRYYDDDLGKFPTVDPVTATSVGGNFNRYWYANNNPYRFTDPDGRRSREDRQSEERESRRERKEKRDRARNSDMVITTGQGSKNPVGTIVGAQGVAADAGAIATNRAANGLAQYGWQAGEDAAMWKGMSRTLGRFGSAINFGAGGYEVAFGENVGEQAHGATNIGVGLLTLGRVIAPEVGLTYGAADLAVSQMEYTSIHVNPGQNYTGWSTFLAARRDYAYEAYTRNDFVEDGW